MKIALAAGGTGGHIFPALALGLQLEKEGHQIFYIGNRNRMEGEIIPKQTNFTFLNIDNFGLNPGIIGKVKGVLSQFKAIGQAIKLCRQYRFDCMISFGGYVTFPIAKACQYLKIPYFIHEQNAIAGKANLMIQKKAKAVFTCYDGVLAEFSNPNKFNFGNPRESVVANQEQDLSVYETYGLNRHDKIVYVVMGSLGADSFSELFIDLLNKVHFPNIQFLIATARSHSLYQKRISSLNKVILSQFVQQLPVLKVADFVISRAGASSVAEIMTSHVPSLLIPSPYVVKNHQYFNAKECFEKQACFLIEEQNLSEAALIKVLNQVDNQDLMDSMSKNTKLIAKPNAIFDMIEKIYEELRIN